MPELPEVETIRKILEPQMKGQMIETVLVRRAEVVAYPSAEEFCECLKRKIVVGMQRRGKFLCLVLDNGDRIVLHLRMTGCLLFTPCDYPEEKHTHIVFRFRNKMELRFSDSRRFGRFWLLQSGENDMYTGMSKLGKEPFNSDFTGDYLYQCFKKCRKPIKGCLLDQSAIAGIGNIYADEILFYTKILPIKSANTLTMEEWNHLARNIPNRLSYFIEKNAMTPEEYLAGKGKDYRNTPFLQVYGQSGKPCPVCGEVLCKVVIGGRSSVYCPKCQKG